MLWSGWWVNRALGRSSVYASGWVPGVVSGNAGERPPDQRVIGTYADMRASPLILCHPPQRRRAKAARYVEAYRDEGAFSIETAHATGTITLERILHNAVVFELAVRACEAAGALCRCGTA